MWKSKQVCIQVPALTSLSHGLGPGIVSQMNPSPPEMKLGRLPLPSPARPRLLFFPLPLVRFSLRAGVKPGFHTHAMSAPPSPALGDEKSPLRCVSAHICPGAFLSCLCDL